MADTRAAGALALPADIRLLNATAALFVAIGVLALLGTGAAALARHPVFALQALRIEGDVSRNSRQTIRANALPRLSGTYFTADLAAAKAAFESVPWVREAVVRRVFPNRLVVRFEEHVVAARWGDDKGDDGDRFVNSRGEVFQANPGDVEDDALPVLAGPEGSAARMLALHTRLAEATAPLARIEKLELSTRGSWRATFGNGAVVELGRAAGADEATEAAEIAERTRRFVATLPEVARRYQGALVYADLRHRDGYALRLKGVSTTTATDTNKPGRGN